MTMPYDGAHVSFGVDVPFDLSRRNSDSSFHRKKRKIQRSEGGGVRSTREREGTLLLQLLLLVLILVVFLLRHDARPVGMYIEIHCEGFRRVAEKHLRALAVIDAQRALQRAVTESTETDFYSSLAPSRIVPAWTGG